MSKTTKRGRTAPNTKKTAHSITSASPATRPRAEETAAYLAAIVESAEDAIVSKTLDGIVTSWNASAERMFGYTEQEMLGQPILRVIPPDRHSEENLILARIRAGERIEHFETVRLRKDGQPLEVSLTISPVRDKAGAIIGASKIVRDITERRRLELEAATWAAQLDATFDALTDGLFIFDSAGQLTRMNDAARAILALHAAPDYYALTPAERTARMQLRDATDRLLAPEEWGLGGLAQGKRLVEPVELRITALDGHTKDLAITGGPVRGSEGKIMGAVALLRDVTERRRLERAVTTQASQLQATFDALAEPMSVFDAEGRIVRQNRAEIEIFGFNPPPATIEERAALIELRDPEGRRIPSERLPARSVLAGETLVGVDAIQLVARGADGNDRWFLVGGAPIRNTAGNVTGGVIVYRDITERRHLGQQTRWQASLLERAHDAIFMWELGGPIIYWNHGAELLYGYTKDEAVGRVSHQLLQTTQPMAHALFEAELQRTGEWIGELVHMTRDGRHLVVESRHQLLVESDGRQFVLETCRDITERLELEAEVRMSEMRLRLALDAAAMGTFIWHVAEDRTEADAQMLALFGLAPDGAITLAQALATMIHPEDTNRYAEAVARAIDPEGGGELREDIRVLLPDGSQRWLAVVGQVFFEREPRRPTYMAGAVTNITDRKDAEEALQRARSELEQRVRERTRELASANRSLRRLSRQVLEVQETERRRIARELHDEIGQALTGVKMMLETASLRNDARGPKEAAGIPPLFEERALIEDTLNRVRDLSLDLRPAMLDSLGLLPTLLWRFETYTRQTSIQVEFHHTRLDQRFAADIETGAYRIVQEALTNVARHAEVDVVRVQAKATKDKLRIFVIDEGRGFEANEAIAAGLSTGLASMRERATLLGGAFLVSSTPDAGTTIEVELPLSVGE